MTYRFNIKTIDSDKQRLKYEIFHLLVFDIASSMYNVFFLGGKSSRILGLLSGYLLPLKKKKKRIQSYYKSNSICSGFYQLRKMILTIFHHIDPVWLTHFSKILCSNFYFVQTIRQERCKCSERFTMSIWP